MNYQREYPNHYDLPKKIERLKELAYNLWWVWNPEGQRLFSYIDRPLWESLNHNPIAFLHQVDSAKLDQAAKNEYYLDDYSQTMNCWINKLHIFPLNLGCMNPCPFMPAGWVFWQVII
jgi:glucan phosphorylase